MLVVVGRQDTGDLEAQIRGSRFAWDMRVISVDALLRMLKLKEEVEDPSLLKRIHNILIPHEFTRLDPIIEIAFAAVADVNFDGLPDLYITRLGYGSLYVRSSAGYYDDRMWASGLGLLTQSLVGWGGVFLDMDNDTDPDLCIVNGSAFVLTGSVTLLLENDGQGRFTDAGNRGGVFFQTPVNGRGNAVLDYDNDGRLDLLLTLLADRPVLLRNRASGDRRWLKLQLEGTRSNRNGYGALITLSAGGRVHQAEAMCPTGFLMQSDARVHFGLGTATRVDRIEIRWPSGVRQALEDLPVDQILKVREPLP